LVWTLKNVGLHYRKGEDGDEDNELTEDMIEELDSLSEEEWEKLQKKLRDFISQRDDRRPRKAAEEMGIEIDEEEEDGVTIEEEQETATVDPTMVKLSHDFPDTVEEAVTDWGIYKPADESLKIIDENKRAQGSVRRMRQHPWEVNSIRRKYKIPRAAHFRRAIGLF
jgi:hypothetical protein